MVSFKVASKGGGTADKKSINANRSTELMEFLPVFSEIISTLQDVHQHLNSFRTVIAALPDDQRGEAAAAALSVTQKLGDLYSDFAADMLRLLVSEGRA